MILTEEHQMIRDVLRTFAQERLAPNAARWDREHHFPKDELKELAQLGAFGVAVPEEYGGAGLDYGALALVLEEIAAGDGGTSTIISVNNCPVCSIAMMYATEAPKQQWLRPPAAGEMLGAFGLTQPDTGSRAAASQSVGMARAAYEGALVYARERTSFGSPIFDHQAVQFRLAEMAMQIEAARQLILHAASMKDAGLPCLKEAAMAKLFASEMAERVVSSSMQVFGGYGYVADFPVERIYRDVRVCQIYEGTSDIQKILIARAL